MSDAAVVQAGEVRSARVEGLRAVGSLGVLAGHLYGVSVLYGPRAYDSWGHRIVLGAGFGAFVLLALSGYLLSLPFLRRDFGGGTPVDLSRYARNRVLRVFPLYYTVLVVVMLLQEHGGSGGAWWRFLTFSENFSHATVGRVDGPMWTLVDELHFYLLLPLVAWVLGRCARGRLSLAAAALVVLAAGSIAVSVVSVDTRTHPSLLWQYSTPANLFYFVSGMLVAVLRLALERRARPLPGPLGRSDAWLLAALALWLFVCWRFRDFELLGLVAMLAIGGIVLPLRPGRLAALLGLRGVVAIGLASYSLYLWHYPILTWLGGHRSLRPFGILTLTAGVLSLFVALISYRVIEAPFLGLRRRWSPAAAPQGSRA